MNVRFIGTYNAEHKKLMRYGVTLLSQFHMIIQKIAATGTYYLQIL